MFANKAIRFSVSVYADEAEVYVIYNKSGSVKTAEYVVIVAAELESSQEAASTLRTLIWPTTWLSSMSVPTSSAMRTCTSLKSLPLLACSLLSTRMV